MGNWFCCKLCCGKAKFEDSLIHGNFSGSFGPMKIGKHEIVAFGTDFKANWVNDFVIRMEWDDSTSTHDELLVYIVKTDSYAHVMEKSPAPISDALKFKGGAYMYWRSRPCFPPCCCIETTLFGRDRKRQLKIKMSLPNNIHGHFKKINIPIGKPPMCNQIQHETYGTILINWLNPMTFLFIHPAYDNKELYVYDTEADGWWVFPDQKGTIWATRHKNKKSQFLKRLGLDEILTREQSMPPPMPAAYDSFPKEMHIQRPEEYTEEQKAKIRNDVTDQNSDSDSDGTNHNEEAMEANKDETTDYRTDKNTRRTSVDKNRRRSSVTGSPTATNNERRRSSLNASSVATKKERRRSSLAGSPTTTDNERRRSSGSPHGRHRQTSVSGLRKISQPNIYSEIKRKSSGGKNQPTPLNTLGNLGGRRGSSVYIESMGTVMDGEDSYNENRRPLDRIRRTSVSNRRRSSGHQQFITHDTPADIAFK